MQSAQRLLKERIGVQLRDARNLTRHGTSQFELQDDRCYADAAPYEIFAMQRSGRCPSQKALYDKSLVEAVSRIYAADIALYEKLFGDSQMLFTPQLPGQPAATPTTARASASPASRAAAAMRSANSRSWE